MTLAGAREAAARLRKAAFREVVSAEDFAWLLSKMRNEETTEAEFREVQNELFLYAERVHEQLFSGRFTVAPLFELYERDRALLFAKEPVVDAFLRRLVARQRDVTAHLHEHIEFRRRVDAGNTVGEVNGRPGLTKSSCVLGLMEEHNGLLERVRSEGSDALARRVLLDIQDVPATLEALGPGDAFMMDETLHLVGEGSKTASDTLANIEDTLRAAQTDFWLCNPGGREGHTTALRLVARAKDPNAKETVFELFMTEGAEDPIPLGNVVLPWASPEVWAAYAPVKAANVERTKAAQFHGFIDMERVCAKLFKEPMVVARIKYTGLPNKGEWTSLIVEFGGSMSGSQASTAAGRVVKMLEFLRDVRDAPAFREAYGFDPPPGMAAAARAIGDRGGVTDV